MKNFLQENGILVVLYGVVGVLAVTAGTLTYTGYKEARNVNVKKEEVREVESNLSESFKDKENEEKLEAIKKLREELKESGEKEARKEKEEKESNNIDNKNASNEKMEIERGDGGVKSTEDKIEWNDQEEIREEGMKEDVEEIEETFNLFKKKRNEDKVDKIKEPKIKEEKEEIDIGNIGDVEKENKANRTSYEKFKKGDKLKWPVEGEVLMPFNEEKLVYDKTLDQYRTNSNIAIKAEKGSKVSPSADGKVIDVGVSKEDNGYVVIEHGNGYVTKYSQLISKHIVKVGDIVLTEDIIGHVGSPSNNSVMLGNHLKFEVIEENKSSDPTKYLE